MDTLMYIYTKGACFVFNGLKCEAVRDLSGEPLAGLEGRFREAALLGVVPQDALDNQLLDIAYLIPRSGYEPDPESLSPLVDIYLLREGEREWMFRIRPLRGDHSNCTLGPIHKIRAAPQTMRTTLGAVPVRALTPPSGVQAVVPDSSGDTENDPKASAS